MLPRERRRECALVCMDGERGADHAHRLTPPTVVEGAFGGYAASPAFETTWRRETEWGRGSALSRDVCLPGCVHVCTCRVCVCMSMYACYVTNAWDRQAVYVPAVSCNVREYRL